MFEHNLNAKSTYKNTEWKREIKNPILIFKVACFCQITMTKHPYYELAVSMSDCIKWNTLFVRQIYATNGHEKHVPQYASSITDTIFKIEFYAK